MKKEFLTHDEVVAIMEKENLEMLDKMYYVYDTTECKMYSVFGKDLFHAVEWYNPSDAEKCKTVKDCIYILESKYCIEFLTWEQYCFLYHHPVLNRNEV